MLRVVLAIIVPLAAPTGLYLLWIIVSRPEGADGVLRWSSLPWLWLAAAGAALLGAVLFLVTVRFGTPQNGVYVPPRYINGQIVPGHVDPAPVR